jgi:hypothetical protein
MPLWNRRGVKEQYKPEGFASQDAFIAELRVVVQKRFASFVASQPGMVMLSLVTAELVIRAIVPSLVEALFEVWKEDVLARCKRVGEICPRCGVRRKCKERNGMKVDILALTFWVPRLYLECPNCQGRSVSIVRLITGLKSGTKSLILQLRAAYCAAKESYQKASDSLRVHYNQVVERTTVRKLSLEIERRASAYVDAQRNAGLAIAATERRRRGHPVLEVTGDGGKVRTGTLVRCRPGDPGFGQTSPIRQDPKKTWDVSWKELITLDVRIPGAVDPQALDVLVPVLAGKGDRALRMLALAIRAGLGDNTEVFGLGDMGSELAHEFDEAFIAYNANWCADWTHTCGYVQKAGSVLQGLDTDDWKGRMRHALWDHDRSRVNGLLTQAAVHRVQTLPSSFEKCPIAALRTYVTNNWSYFRFAERCEQGMAYVSARAESQVRDRTKDRFAGPGVWKVENIEPKATLRAIIAEGKWDDFVNHQLMSAQNESSAQLTDRLTDAVARGLLDPGTVRDVLGITIRQEQKHERYG